MKTNSFLVAGILITGFSLNLVRAETLQLKVIPERDYLLSGSSHDVVFKIDLSAIGRPKHKHRTPLNLSVVLDRSGSMSGSKIEKARQAAMGLVDQLGPDDIFSLVTYSTDATVEIHAQKVEDKQALKSRIARVQAGGNTALHAGVSLGAKEVQNRYDSRQINRVILLSDGLANVGPSSTEDLKRLGRDLAGRGVAVTTIGVGDDYNEDLMAGLAESSDANYYYVKDTEKLPQIFAKELGELMAVAARDITIEIHCSKGVQPIALIGRPEQFQNQRATARLNYFTPDQNRFLLLHCRVPDGVAEVADIRVGYLDELDAGQSKTLNAVARIDFTRDSKLVEKSLNGQVAAEKALLVAAVTKDQSLADADAGKLTVAAERLAREAASLEKQEAQAPEAMRGQIRQEIVNLQQRSEQLRNNQYDAGTRKVMQSESWLYRNSK